MSSQRKPPDVRFEFDHDPSASRQARDAIAPLVNDPADPIADDVTLTVSELVTNVVRYTVDGGVLEAWDPNPDVPLRVEVTDTDADTSGIAPVREAREVGGLGLHIVDSVADQWGVERGTTGKTVWAEFDRNARRNAPPKTPPSPSE